MNMKRLSGRCLGKYAFLIHPTTSDDLYTSGPASFRDLTLAQRHNWERWIASWSQRHYEPGIVYHLPAVHSRAGGYAEGWLIGIALTPEQLIRLKRYESNRLMAECVAMARDLNVDVLGLGAFTSVITRNGADLTGCGVNITTGNSLTAMAAVESLKSVAYQQGKDLGSARIGVIGAGGSVGRLACKGLAKVCGDITLFGNPANPSSIQKLKAVAGDLYLDATKRLLSDEASAIGARLVPLRYKLEHAYLATSTGRNPETYCRFYDYVTACFTQRGDITPPITLTVNLEHYLPKMQCVISATSQGTSFIDVRLLTAGAIVCDAARPPDVHTDLRESRPDVFVYEGGLVKLPERVSFGQRNIIGCAAGINLACLSETIALTMSGIRRDYSVGAELSLDEAEEVLRLARHHGFEVFLPDDGAPAEALAH